MSGGADEEREQALAAAQHVATRLRGQPVERILVEPAPVSGYLIRVQLNGMLSERGWSLLQAAEAEVDEPEWGGVSVVVEAPEELLGEPGEKDEDGSDVEDDGVVGEAASRLQGVWSAYVFQAPGVTLTMRTGIRGTTAAVLEVDGTVTLLDGAGRVQSRGHRPVSAVGDVALPSATPGALYVPPSPNGVPMTDAAGALAWVRYTYLRRASGQWTKDPVGAAAIVTGVEQIATGPTAYAVFASAFDQAVRLGSAVNTEPLAEWATEQVRGNRLGKPWDQVYDPMTERERCPAAHFARNAALYMSAAFNPDAQRDPSLRPVLLQIAAETVSAPAWMLDSWSAGATGSMYGWLLKQRVPAAATGTRAYLQNSAEIAGFKPATTWDIVTSAAVATVDDIKAAADAIKPPGGWGVGVTLGIVTAAGVAAWKLTRK